MTKKNDGGQAFPRMESYSPEHPQFLVGYDGMSLRDYFAAQAVIAVMRAFDEVAKRGIPTVSELNRQSIAQASYLIADAMIAEREKSG